MLIRVLVLSSFVLAVNLVAGIFAREIKLPEDVMILPQELTRGRTLKSYEGLRQFTESSRPQDETTRHQPNKPKIIKRFATTDDQRQQHENPTLTFPARRRALVPYEPVRRRSTTSPTVAKSNKRFFRAKSSEGTEEETEKDMLKAEETSHGLALKVQYNNTVPPAEKEVSHTNSTLKQETESSEKDIKDVNQNVTYEENEKVKEEKVKPKITIQESNITSTNETTNITGIQTVPLRKRRLPLRPVETTSFSPGLPIVSALTMSESLYNHFRPLDKDVPEDDILPFLTFGKKLVQNAKTPSPITRASSTSSTNSIEVVTNPPRIRIYPSITQKGIPTEPIKSPHEEEVHEDMDVSIVNPVVENNKVGRSKSVSLFLRTLGGLYRKQTTSKPEENLVSNNGSYAEDSQANESALVLIKPSAESYSITRKKQIPSSDVGILEEHTVLKFPEPSPSKIPPSTSETPSATHVEDLSGITGVTPSTVTQSTVYVVKQPTSTRSPVTEGNKPSPSTLVRSSVPPTQALAPSSLIEATLATLSTKEPIIRKPFLLTTRNASTFSLINRRRHPNVYLHSNRNIPAYRFNSNLTQTERFNLSKHLKLTPENITLNAPTSPSNKTVTPGSAVPENSSKSYAIERQGSVIRNDPTQIPGKLNGSVLFDQRRVMNTEKASSFVPTTSRLVNFDVKMSTPLPTLTTTSLAPPTTKILSTAVVTSVSVRGEWPSAITEVPPRELTLIPPQEKDEPNVQEGISPNETTNAPFVVNGDPMGNDKSVGNVSIPADTERQTSATLSMIQDLLSNQSARDDRGKGEVDPPIVTEITEERNDEAHLNASVERVPQDQRKLFSNTSVLYSTSYSRNIDTATEDPPVVNTTNSSVPETSSSKEDASTVIPEARESAPTIPTPSKEINSTHTESNVKSASLDKGRSLWNTTTRTLPFTTTESVPTEPSSTVVGSFKTSLSDKDFDLPIIKLYNATSISGLLYEGQDTAIPTVETPKNEPEAPTQTEAKTSETVTQIPAPQDNDTSFNIDDDHSTPTVLDTDEGTDIPDTTLLVEQEVKGVDAEDIEGSHEGEEGKVVQDVERKVFKAIGSNVSEEGSGPREEEINVVVTAQGVGVAIYVLAALGVISIFVGFTLTAKYIVKKRRKLLDDSDTYSDVSSRPGAGSDSGQGTPGPGTKLPRVATHLNWEQEKTSTAATTAMPATRWEFPRSKLRLQTVLGQGNFGQVLKAEADDLSGHQGMTRLVAVKTVKEGATSREKEDLIRELEIMQQLGVHPNVVTLIGCCTEQEPYLLIMEYVMYGKLLAFLRDHRMRQHYYNFSEDSDALTSRDLTVFGYCVARGMEYLASKGIIHRDLAARNVLVDHNKLCKIADFGMSRNVREVGEIYEQRHTKGALPIRWMAPESLLYRMFTHKSDVWSYGILMWEVVTLGSTPYPTMGAREVMKRVREGYRLERPNHCRTELFRVISRCWSSDPNKRPDFAELRHEFGVLLEDSSQGGGYVDLESFAESKYNQNNRNNTNTSTINNNNHHHHSNQHSAQHHALSSTSSVVPRSGVGGNDEVVNI